MMFRVRFILLLGVFVAGGAVSGCRSQAFQSIQHPTDTGQLGSARRSVLGEQVRPIDQPLREATLAILTLDDGLPKHAEVPMQRVYENLRTRGLNANKQVAAKVLNEDLKTWKGEPYEQAILYLSVAMQQAMVGEWGNTRAASDSALELLDEYDLSRGINRNLEATSHGYVVAQSDLALAYLLSSVANRALGRVDEADDHLERVEQIRPQLSGLTEILRSGEYDTLLVVEFGAGPVLEQAGSDGSIEQLVTRWPSDDRVLSVRDERGLVGQYPRVLDVNAFAGVYQWQGLADLRRGKSNVGSLMTLGGAGLLTSDDEGARWAGLGLLLGGLFAKGGAHADDRSLAVLPQRHFMVPVRAAELVGPIELRLGSGVGESMVLSAIKAPSDGVQLIVVRVPSRGLNASGLAGEILYANDSSGQRVAGDELPYILGGRCVQSPSSEALARYQAAGFLKGMTTADLRELYRLEGIVLPEDERPGVPPDAHVLEGGRSLAAPVEGTLGFVRLFCTEHSPYRPRSEEVARLASELRKQMEVSR